MTDSYGWLNSTNELRKLVIDNPDLPLIVFAGEDANNEYCKYMLCANVTAEMGEYLNCDVPCDDIRAYLDRDTFRDDMEEMLEDELFCDDLSDDEFQEKVEKEVAKYDEYWIKCIVLYVNN